jgi:hypothetical protein
MSVARICPTTNLKTISAGHSPILREKRLKTLKLNIKHPFASDCIHQLLKNMKYYKPFRHPQAMLNKKLNSCQAAAKPKGFPKS